MRGTLSLANKNAVPVDAVHLFFAQGEVEHVDSARVRQRRRRSWPTIGAIGLRSYRLATPLAPGATTTMAFDLDVADARLQNSGANTAVVANGSFVNGQFALPVIGYSGPRRARRPTATAGNSGWRRRSGCATATIPPASPTTTSATTPTGSPSRRGRHRRGPDRHRAGLPAEREWTDGDRRLFRLCDGLRRSSTSSPSSRRATR